MEQPEVKTNPVEKRRRSFQEVSLGYSKQIALEESKRCLQCSDPVCVKGCPLEINIPSFIRQLREGNMAGAYKIVKDKNWLPAICGRICAAPCEAACVLQDELSPIGIRALERYTVDHGKKSAPKIPANSSGKKIAIVGSGPSGLTAAVELIQLGYQVTIFESLDKPGGVLRYGIPEFRLPKKILDQEIYELKSMGVNIKTNYFIGQTLELQEIFKEGFTAILLAMGAGVPKFMDIPGANLGGVYYGEEFLMRINLIKANLFSQTNPNFFIGNRVAVIGAGNSAIDCARVCLRFGREVKLISRRSEEQLLIRPDERKQAKQEGVQLETLVKPVEILGNTEGFVTGIKCIRVDYARENDATDDWVLEEVPDSEFTIDTDTVVIATGHQPNFVVSKLSPDLKLNGDHTIQVDETGMTSIKNIFACGNVVTNAGPVVSAMASGKKAANNIHSYLNK